MANPNPQPFPKKWKGVRETGYPSKSIDPAKVTKFGKRMNVSSDKDKELIL
jgi:hypothetical protein